MAERIAIVSSESNALALREHASRQNQMVVLSVDTDSHVGRHLRNSLKKGAGFTKVLCNDLHDLASSSNLLAKLIGDLIRAGVTVETPRGEATVLMIMEAVLGYRGMKYGSRKKPRKQGLDGVRRGDEIAKLIANGHKTRDISAQLGVAPGTVVKVRKIMQTGAL